MGDNANWCPPSGRGPPIHCDVTAMTDEVVDLALLSVISALDLEEFIFSLIITASADNGNNSNATNETLRMLSMSQSL